MLPSASSAVAPLTTVAAGFVRTTLPWFGEPVASKANSTLNLHPEAERIASRSEPVASSPGFSLGFLAYVDDV